MHPIHSIKPSTISRTIKIHTWNSISLWSKLEICCAKMLFLKRGQSFYYLHWIIQIITFSFITGVSLYKFSALVCFLLNTWLISVDCQNIIINASLTSLSKSNSALLFFYLTLKTFQIIFETLKSTKNISVTYDLECDSIKLYNFCCGSLLLLVLAVRIYNLVRLLCEWHILIKFW